jgi:hypothetical protein
MDEYTFQRELFKARAHRYCGERPDYWQGYESGLIHAHCGAQSANGHDQERLMGLTGPGEVSLSDHERGYRDGIVTTIAAWAA